MAPLVSDLLYGEGDALTVAVIAARIGSKGLPRKNLCEVRGKPLVAWSVEDAMGSIYVDHVVLTTDDTDISDAACDEVAKFREATDNERPSYHCYYRSHAESGDEAPVDAAARHGLDCWEIANDLQGKTKYVAILYGNVAYRPMGLIDQALLLLDKTGCDSVQSVYPVGKIHPLWMRTVDPVDGALRPYEPNSVYRRQDLPPLYMIDGGALVMTRSCLYTVDPNNPHAYLGYDRRAIITEPGQVMDIDTPEDLSLACRVTREPLAHTGAYRCMQSHKGA